MTRRIRAAVLNRAPGELEIEELLIDNPGPEEVLIEVGYAGLCHSDLHEIDATFPTQLPIVLGHEVVGRVSSIGSAVTEVGVGDVVVTCLSMFCGSCEHCIKGNLTLCVRRERIQQDRPRARLTRSDGSPVRATAGIGGFAEAVLVHQSGVVAVPEDIRQETLSILGCAVTTGMGAVLHSASVRVGDRVAVVGLGGVGFAAIQAARLAGAAQVIGVDVVPEKLRRAAHFGATDVVNGREVDAVDAVRALTDGGVDHALEAVGSGTTAAQAFGMLRPGGTATVMGMIPATHAIAVSGTALFLEEKRLQGSFMGSNHFKTDVPLYAQFERMGLLHLGDMITSVVDLDTINEGFSALASGNEIRVVAKVGEI